MPSEHVLVSASSVCKITAIGRSRALLEKGHVAGDKAGQRWAAPEVLRTKMSSMMGDVWSLGVTM
jgi:hypothetical protein